MTFMRRYPTVDTTYHETSVQRRAIKSLRLTIVAIMLAGTPFFKKSIFVRYS